MAANYYIDKDKKVIVCKITNCSFDVINLIRKLEKNKYLFFSEKELDMYYINDSYVGKVECKSGDIYDEKYGKKLAKEIMLKKYHAAKDKALLRYINNYLNKTEIAINYMSKFTKSE